VLSTRLATAQLPAAFRHCDQAGRGTGEDA